EEEQDSFLAALQAAWDQTSNRRPEIDKLAVNQDGRTILIPYDQIIFVEAFEDYSYVHTANQKFLSSHRLKNLEDRLGPHRFFRVHRKYLVNLDMVTEIASMPGSNFMLRTAGRTRIELPISRRRIAELKKIIGL
ncbi:MAG TPA: LytTR family DNA-binding domain-containing protein, partial [Pseudodesulfovibrio sp.]|nr:LytTR family DNA-binding domain-containing protein [Pseudodesulfovibrio sp.]